MIISVLLLQLFLDSPYFSPTQIYPLFLKTHFPKGKNKQTNAPLWQNIQTKEKSHTHTKHTMHFILANHFCTWGLHWRVMDIPNVTHSWKLSFPFPGRCQLSIASWLGLGLVSFSLSLCWDFVLFELVLYKLSLWVHVLPVL